MKPEYHLLNNARYTLEETLALLKNEMAFRLELCVIIPVIVFSFFLDVSFLEHLFLVAVLILILTAEALNPTTEACMDLITNGWHEKVKAAKDCASTAVFFNVCLVLFIWGFILGKLWL